MAALMNLETDSTQMINVEQLLYTGREYMISDGDFEPFWNNQQPTEISGTRYGKEERQSI